MDLKLIIETIEFDKDGFVNIQDANEQLLAAGIIDVHTDDEQATDNKFSSIEDILNEFDDVLEYDYGDKSTITVTKSEEREGMLYYAVALKEKITREDAMSFINSLNFDENGILDIAVADAQLKAKGMDMFGFRSIRGILAASYGNKMFYDSVENGPKSKVTLSIIEDGGKEMLRKSIEQMEIPKDFDEKRAYATIVEGLNKSPEKKMLLTEIGNYLREKGIVFNKPVTLGGFISMYPDSLKREMEGNRDYCTLIKPQKKTIQPTTPQPIPAPEPSKNLKNNTSRYSLRRIIFIDPSTDFYGELAAIAQEDATWFKIDEDNNPYKFLAWHMEVAFAYALRNQNSEVLQADFFKGSFDTGLFTDSGQKIFILFSRNQYPDAERPQPWIFDRFEIR